MLFGNCCRTKEFFGTILLNENNPEIISGGLIYASTN